MEAAVDYMVGLDIILGHMTETSFHLYLFYRFIQKQAEKRFFKGLIKDEIFIGLLNFPKKKEIFTDLVLSLLCYSINKYFRFGSLHFRQVT